MWNHFKELGKWQKGGTGDVGMGEQIFQELKTRLGEGGRFFKKSNYSGELFEVDDSVARQSEYQDTLSLYCRLKYSPTSLPPPEILRDLKRRMESSSKWLDKESLCDTPTSTEARPSLTPTRNARRESPEQMSSIDAETKPKLSPSRHPQRGGSPPEIHPPAVNPEKRLAPIFLKNYGKKKTAPAQRPPTDSQDPKEESSTRTSRYPGRKRKQTSDDSYVVSDDAVSVDAFVPSKKKVKSER